MFKLSCNSNHLKKEIPNQFGCSRMKTKRISKNPNLSSSFSSSLKIVTSCQSSIPKLMVFLYIWQPILTCNHEKRLVKPLGGNLDGMNVWRTQYLWFSKCTLVLWSHCLSLPLNKTDTVWGRFFTLALSTCVACQMKMQLLPCLLVSLTCMLYIFETKQKKLKWGRGKYASSIVVKVKGILWINQLIKRWDM